jgi:hypothetical protein
MAVGLNRAEGPYRTLEDLVLDAAVGRSFTSRPQVEFFATVGLTWTFEAPLEAPHGAIMPSLRRNQGPLTTAENWSATRRFITYIL